MGPTALSPQVHVLYTAHRFHPSVGGTEQAVLSLARAVRDLGHEVTVATSAEPGAPVEETLHGIRVRRFALRQAGRFRFPPREYARFVVEGPWDVAHLHGQRVWSTDYLLRHATRFKARGFLTAHGFYQWHMGWRSPLEHAYYRWHLPRAMRAFHGVVSLTTGERDEWSRFGVPRGKLHVVPNGVDLADFARAPPPGFKESHDLRSPVVLYAGGFYANKRVEFLVEAASRWSSDATLVIAGPDPTGGRTRERVERQARRLKAPVRFVGTLDRPSMLQAFFESDLFALASSFEGYGLVLLEAMAARVPFVATPAGAASDLAREGAGRLVATPAEMASAVDALLKDEAMRRAMGERGAKVARAFTWERAAKAHVTLYEGAR